uniref:Putative secreted protein n=1 Tax=Ixodes ricinus TaxID=34613 RepID=A0A6B0UTK9_IXORI
MSVAVLSTWWLTSTKAHPPPTALLSTSQSDMGWLRNTTLLKCLPPLTFHVATVTRALRGIVYSSCRTHMALSRLGGKCSMAVGRRARALSANSLHIALPRRSTSMASCLLLSRRLFWIVRTIDREPSFSLDFPSRAPVPA